MRIIGGTFGGRTLRLPKGLPARPTTDRAKEALFNILNHRIHWEETDVLDLFTGTGNIAIECASRGARSVLAIDKDGKSISALQSTIREWGIEALSARKADIKLFMKEQQGPFGFIFLDPPYDWDGVVPLVVQLVSEGWLTEEGTLVAEHRSSRDLSQLPGWVETRTYGDSQFSFFEILSESQGE